MPCRFVALVALSSSLACGGGAVAPDAGSSNTSTADGGTQDAGGLDRTGLSCNGSAQPSATDAPDLAIDRINGSSSYDSTTGDLKIGFSYGNAGRVAAGPYKIGIFLYPDVSDRCEAYYLSEFTKGGLEPSHFHSGTATTHLKGLPLPVPKGDYEVGFVLDVENVLTESREDNNMKVLGIVRL